MHFRKTAKSPYLASQDLWDESKSVYVDIVATIENVEMRMSEGLAKNDIFMFAIFKEPYLKDMIINATNSKVLRKICKSPETNDWIGKKICIHTKEVDAFGSVHDALRIRPQLIVEKVVDIKPDLEAIKKCKTLAELQEFYINCPNKVNPKIVAAKDAMKIKLTNKK